MLLTKLLVHSPSSSMSRGTGLHNKDRGKRGRIALGTGRGSSGNGGGRGGGVCATGAEQSRRPSTAPAYASSAAASVAADYVQSKRSVHHSLDHHHHHRHNHFPPPPPPPPAPAPPAPGVGRFPHDIAAAGHNSYPMTPWSGTAGVPMPIPMSMTMPVAMQQQQQQWSRQSRPPAFSDRTSSLSQAKAQIVSLGGPPSLPGTNGAPSAEVVAAATVGGAAVGGVGAPAPATVAVSDAAVEGEEFREIPTAKVKPAVKSSPDSEDTYADSWLAAMPWVASSAPDIDRLQVSQSHPDTTIMYLFIVINEGAQQYKFFFFRKISCSHTNTAVKCTLRSTCTLAWGRQLLCYHPCCQSRKTWSILLLHERDTHGTSLYCVFYYTPSGHVN